MDKVENEYAIFDYGDPVVVNDEVFERVGLVGVAGCTIRKIQTFSTR